MSVSYIRAARRESVVRYIRQGSDKLIASWAALISMLSWSGSEPRGRPRGEALLYGTLVLVQPVDGADISCDHPERGSLATTVPARVGVGSRTMLMGEWSIRWLL